MLPYLFNSAPKMPAYDPSIIEKFADKLYDRGENIIWKWGCLGMLAGGFAAFMVLRSLGELPPPLGLGVLIVGIIIGLAFGRSIGTDRAFHLFLQAQTALCQVQIERNTRRPE